MAICIDPRVHDDYMMYINQIMAACETDGRSDASYTESDTKVKVASTLFSFAFLHLNSETLSNVSTSSFAKQSIQLLNIIDELDTPLQLAEHSTEFDSSHAELKFQKLNRYLFKQADEIIEKHFLQVMNVSENEEVKESLKDWAYPVIEWASNVMPTFELIFLTNAQTKELEYSLILDQINRFDTNELVSYLKLGWNRVINHLESARNGNNSRIQKLISRLRCSMCYPARVSILGE